MKNYQSKFDEDVGTGHIARRRSPAFPKFLRFILALIFLVFISFSLGLGIQPTTITETHYLSETLGYDASAPREPDGEPTNPASGDNALRVIDRSLINDDSKPVTEKIVYLTFDDGPGPYTADLLDTLKKYNVKATFFVTGAGDDGLLTREYREGHSIGLHTFSHNYEYVYSSVDNFFADLYRVQDRVKNATGYTSYLMRFPGGSSNAISARYDGGTHIMSRLANEVSARGFTYFDWNVSSGDAGGATSAAAVYQNVTNALKPTESVVLQHDVKDFSVAAVEDIIRYGLENGYTFKKLDASSFTAHHGINN